MNPYPESAEEVESLSKDHSGKDELITVLEEGASVHIKDLNALILEQKNAKTRTKKKYIQKKIDKKKDIVLEYMENMARLRGQ